MLAKIEGFVCPADQDPSRGYQQELAEALESHLSQALKGPVRSKTPALYSPRLGLKADLRLGLPDSEMDTFVEIAFRPHVGHDLVKFQVGYNCGTLSAAVLVLAVDRRQINPGYGSMPQFEQWLRIILEYKPEFPLLLVGISGEFL